MCSHLTSVYYWSQALDRRNSKLFASYKCSSWDRYLEGSCSNNEVNFMGIAANPNLRGSFFIKLQSKFNFDIRPIYTPLLPKLQRRVEEVFGLHLPLEFYANL
jgi:hypothetical protein